MSENTIVPENTNTVEPTAAQTNASGERVVPTARFESSSGPQKH
jgi:hypothetical protein